MATSEIAVCNIALVWLGCNQISSFPPAQTIPEAVNCEAVYDEAKHATLEDRDWTFAAKRDTLVPLAMAPDFGYAYKFQIPADCLRLRFVSQQPFRTQPKDNLDWQKEGDEIFADVSKVYIKYTKIVTDPTDYSPGFTQALAAKIAMQLAIPLTGSKDLEDRMTALYEKLIDTGGTVDNLQGKQPEVRASKLVNARMAGPEFNIFIEP